jgi:hypothetical protein
MKNEKFLGLLIGIKIRKILKKQLIWIRVTRNKFFAKVEKKLISIQR